MTHKITRQQFIDRLRETDPFADEGQFGRLDLSGCPSFFEAELADLESKPDMFAPADYSGQNGNSLRDFLRGIDSDDEAIAEAAKMPGAPANLVAEFKVRKATEIAVQFKRAAGGRYLETDDNMDALVKTLAKSALGYSNADTEQLVTEIQDVGFWTVDNLLTVFNAVFDAGELPDYPKGVYRPLRGETWEQISRMSQAGQILPALVLGLECALDRNLSIGVVLDNVVADPAYRGLVNGLTLFIWKAATPQFNEAQSGEFQEFLMRYAGTRPWNIPILNEAYRAFLHKEAAAPEPEPQTYEREDFDQLDDASLENLRLAVIREKNRSRR